MYLMRTARDSKIRTEFRIPQNSIATHVRLGQILAGCL